MTEDKKEFNFTKALDETGEYMQNAIKKTIIEIKSRDTFPIPAAGENIVFDDEKEPTTSQTPEPDYIKRLKGIYTTKEE